MPRYIDADALAVKWMLANTQERETFRQIIDEEPTADVVPKSEVEKLKADLIVWKQDRFNLYQRLELYEITRKKVAREIFEEIEELAKIYTFPVVKNGVVEIAKEPFWCIEPNDLAKLKKKYTGEK